MITVSFTSVLFYHSTVLQSYFYCTLLVTVILHFTMTFLITHTSLNMLQGKSLFKTLGCAPSDGNAGLALDSSSIPEKTKKKLLTEQRSHEG